MDGINFFDGGIMAFVQSCCHNAFTDTVFPVITYLGEAGILWILAAVILLCRRKTRLWGVSMAAAIAAGFLLGEIVLKNMVCRPRPFQMFPDYAALLIPAPSGWSFPSGHSCSSFAAAAALCRWSKRWGIPALVLAGLIAFSRIFLFVHWPTDVLAGAAMGAGIGLLAAWAVPKIAEKRRKDLNELES